MFIKVKCHPSSKKEFFEKREENSFEIFVKEKPERGEANKKIIQILSEIYGTSTKKLRIIKGAKSPSKIFEIHD